MPVLSHSNPETPLPSGERSRAGCFSRDCSTLPRPLPEREGGYGASLALSIARRKRMLVSLALALACVGCEHAAAPASNANHNASASGGTPHTGSSGDTTQKNVFTIPYADYAEADPNAASGVVLHDTELSCPGYNLYEVQWLSRAELMDNEGHVVREWAHKTRPRWERATLLANGDLAVVGADPWDWQDGGSPVRIHDDARYIARYDWNGKLLWEKRYRVHHDIEERPDGNLLTLTFERRQLPEIEPGIDIRDDYLTLLSPTGERLEARSVLDAIKRSGDVFKLEVLPQHQSSLGGELYMDIFHTNAVQTQRDPNLAARNPFYVVGNVLVCFRHQDRIAMYDWQADKWIWAWGAGELDGPHDAQVLPSGNILVFDNGFRRRNYSRVIELDPLQKKIVWEYKADPPQSFFTRSKGSAQRLPNGNTLIAESDAGRAFEVTPDGDIVWEFLAPPVAGAEGAASPTRSKRPAIVRMIRYPKEVIDQLR